MIFIHNKYTNWYNSIISNANARICSPATYTERHHIIPKSLGGDNSPENLVKLTAREHFICHLLLTKMTTGRMRHKMSKALTMIMSIRRVGERKNYVINSRWYEHSKKLASTVRKDYWTDEQRKSQSIRTTNYFATVDKSTVAYQQRFDGSRKYNLNKVWTEKAIENRLENCLKSAASRKGKKNPNHGAAVFNAYVTKNIKLFGQIWELHDKGKNRHQISIQLEISWEKVNMAVNKRLLITEHDIFKNTKR